MNNPMEIKMVYGISRTPKENKKSILDKLHEVATPHNVDRIVRERDETISDLLEACQWAYRKHHLNDESIGWSELSDKLLDALCNTMGNDKFDSWVNKIT